MRRGELCALRWQDVDLEAGTLRVERSIEETRAGLRIKAPKSARGRRTISLAPSVVAELGAHRQRQLESRMRLGLGKAPADAPTFATWDGRLRGPDNLSIAFSRAMDAIGLPHATLHTLRHTHASMLIRAGVDIVSVSRRLGHGSAKMTLDTYGHLYSPDDRSAAVVETALRGR